MMPSNNTSNTSFYFCPLHLQSEFVSINPEYVPTALFQILYSTFSGNCSKILLWIKILVTVKLCTDGVRSINTNGEQNIAFRGDDEYKN